MSGAYISIRGFQGGPFMADGYHESPLESKLKPLYIEAIPGECAAAVLAEFGFACAMHCLLWTVPAREAAELEARLQDCCSESII